ncbi:glutactin-like [Topomyia yanbarensis]|uniref:glutactin-like n=1 Tax=Topomyia yanbarensis TaxID=2498891 RepID=UPI00273ABB4D|nr:glutactin-like [Topomyia yanbarensis]
MWSVMVMLFCGLVRLNIAQTTTPTVNIQGLGVVQGSLGYSAWSNKTIFKFQAIPYAKPPTGLLRFQPPVKASSWTGILDASKPGVPCPQNSDRYYNVDNEDCLTLSVYSNDLDATRPVMVYIHGGWFFVGGASMYAPDYLFESEIVLVVIQYRLGPFGFLSTLSDKIPGNVGILDMIAALEWVQQHIGHFGGSSSNVTIFGESAGSAAVSALLYSPLVTGRPVPLFNKAILQSGSVFAPWAMCDTPIEGAYDIAKRSGCVEGNYEQCLITQSVENILQAFESHRRDMIIQRGYSSVTGTNVVVGGPSELFPVHPKHYLSQVTNEIAILGGVTSQDGLFLLDEICKLQPEILKSLNSSYDLFDFVRLLHEKFGQTQLSGALEGYEFMNHFLMKEVEQMQWKDIVLGLTDICGAHGIKGPLLIDMHAFARANPGNVYLYTFDYSNLRTRRNMSIDFPYEGIVHHADDLTYLFPRDSLNEKDTKVAKAMVQLWTSFARGGVPFANDIPYWPPMNSLHGPYLKIDERSETKNFYLNELSASTMRFRDFAGGSNQLRLSSILIFLLVLCRMLF